MSEGGYWRARRDALAARLLAHQSLWRPLPFREPEPAWTRDHPSLVCRLRGLPDDAVRTLARADVDDQVLLALLVDELPSLRGLAALTGFPDQAPGAAADIDWRLDWEVPGRKSAQLAAFAASIIPGSSPMLEWCAGKGHLGRLLASRGAGSVVSLEIDGALCAAGDRLAARLGLPQRFRQADALAPGVLQDFAEHHALALHACGDLHRQLVRGAARASLAALDLAPCCYQRTADEVYQPLAGASELVLTREDLRLAVTGAATASASEMAAVETEMAWKLAFQALARMPGAAPGLASDAAPRYRPLAPVARSALRRGFRGYLEALGAREGVVIDGKTDWVALERTGWERQREVARLSLLRFAFRRAIEAFVVCDLAASLEGQGYAVGVTRFCAARLTPRNLLVSARRRPTAG